MTKEQSHAAERLRALQGRFKVSTDDRDGWPVISGQRGRIEYHDDDRLAVFTDHPRLFQKLLAIPGVRRHQAGDTEARMLFRPAALSAVAKVIRARRRRSQASPKSLANLRPRNTSGTAEASLDLQPGIPPTVA